MTYPPGPGRPGSPYGHPPYGRGPYSQPGGFGGPPPWSPPPRRNRTGLWVGLSTVAAALVVFLITGLVAPGFLLGKQDGRPVIRHADDFARPRQVAIALVDGVNSRDKAGLQALTCSSAPAALDRNIERIGVLSDARLTLVRLISPTRAIARLSITLHGTRLQVRSDLRKRGDHWCWQDWNAAGGLENI